MTSYISKKDDFGQKIITPIQSGDLKPFKSSKYFSQPLPGDKDEEVIDWAKALVSESYEYKKGYHAGWHSNMLDYYTKPNLDSAQRVGPNPGVDPEQDSKIMVPALIKRYVDLGAFWVSKEIFKSEPFMQFTNYEMETTIRKIQKLYERKLQGDTETFGAREKATEIGIDLYLYGNSIGKAQFHQERVVCLEIPDPDISMSSEDDLLTEIDMEDPLAGMEVTMDDPYPVYSIVDQYAEFKPVFLGHFIIDPLPSGKDWRRARFMGDVEFVTSEELVERYGEVRGFLPKLERSSEQTTINVSSLPLTGDTDSFLRDWSKYRNEGKALACKKGREIHAITHLYTKYTETCIVDNNIVIYHRYRSKNVVKAGAFPYVMFKLPNPTGALFSSGLGHLLRSLQLEQIILASKRMQTVEEMHRHIITYVGSAVDKSHVQNIDNLTLIEVEQAGAIQEMVPNHGAMNGFLDAEARNFQRAEQYAGIPSILDSSNTKTHLGAVGQRMEAAQVQFDVILNNIRDGFKELFQKMHIYNMAYLEGDISIKGSTGPFNSEFTDNVLDASELTILANQPELSLQLNLGMDVGSEKLQAFAAVINTNPAAQIMQQLQTSGMFTPERQMKLMGMLFEYGGLTEFREIFDVDPAEIAAIQEQQMAAQQMQQQSQGMMPPQGGQTPMM